MSSRFAGEDWDAYAAQCSYSITRMASGKNISRQHLRRCFLQVLGATPKDRIEVLRLKAAIRLLIAGNSVKQVSIELGFSDCSHFIRFFERNLGQSPGEFRRNVP